ncbi:deoxyribodipyrimidine photo-lyase [Micractinium conductrix]|uniref:Deoxyribodipyrimidine photo-lyase n=1 Tax=Micractinium conductrix TaxID=554055 RepID=A0A2P6VR51_9CHLO|nr:deoxyribodipyrimidine photo-lyase [Micractinium conductrix]|eukprot:PSC76560.1 deoxyribodipyrimidine photo-lyase [Micractinium conductrix]
MALLRLCLLLLWAAQPLSVKPSCLPLPGAGCTHLDCQISPPGHHGGVDADGTVRVWQDEMGWNVRELDRNNILFDTFRLSSFAMSLLLSLRVGRNYDRWWTARCGFAGVGSAASTLVGQATSWIDSPQLQADIRRWAVVWHFSILQIVRAAAEPHPTSAALLHEDELYRQSRKPRQLASSQLRLLVCEGRQHGLSEEQAIAMDATIVKGIGDASACVRVRFQAMPHSLTLISTGFLQIWLLLLPLGLWEGTAWFGLVAMFFTALLLLCVDEVATQLENPFPLLPLEEILDSTVRDTGRALEEVDALRTLWRKPRRDGNGHVVLGVAPSDVSCVLQQGARTPGSAGKAGRRQHTR